MEVASQSVQSPHDERVTVSQRLQAMLKLWPVGRLAARLVFVDADRASSVERIALQVKGLLERADARISNN
ncbi:hypothetical protein WK22_00755 [Burkholderia multivorans]|nr:hypothetical protein WK22_00755 [Burkholderia multivorans]